MGSYNSIVTRWVCFVFVLMNLPGATMRAQDKSAAPPAPAPKQQQPPDETNPPEEDESLKQQTYVFNPMEAEHNIKVGNFYMHQGTPRGFRAAAGRFREATKWNPSSAEAFLRLGMAEDKLKNKDAAKAAFEKAMQLAPDSKQGQEAKKKLNAKS